MTICDLMLGKPGGSSQAELQAMCMPLLVVHLHRLWEQGNKEELERVGLSYDRDPSQPLWEQVQQILKSHDREVGQDAGLGWKERFLTQIQQLGR
jgi:UDP-N-acetylglucosamine:LPS N-acetylglucosamine transferase